MQEFICSSEDVLPSDRSTTISTTNLQGDDVNEGNNGDNDDNEQQRPQPNNPTAMYQTIYELIKLIHCDKDNVVNNYVVNRRIMDDENTATNTTNTATTNNTILNNKTLNNVDEHKNYDNYFKTIGIHFPRLTLLPSTSRSLSPPPSSSSLSPSEEEERQQEQQTTRVNNRTPSQLQSQLTNINDNENSAASLITKTNQNYYYNYDIDNGVVVDDVILVDTYTNDKNFNSLNNNLRARKIPDTLDLNYTTSTNIATTSTTITKNHATTKIGKNKRNFMLINQAATAMMMTTDVGGKGKNVVSSSFPLNEIIEECEYDSDIGKFNCRNDYDLNSDTTTTNTSGLSSSATPPQHDGFIINDLNTPKQRSNQFDSFEYDNLNILENDGIDGVRLVVGGDKKMKIVMKRIEFFENNALIGIGDGSGSSNLMTSSSISSDLNEKIENTIDVGLLSHRKNETNDNKNKSTIFLLSMFILTVTLLIMFPLPN